MKDVVYSLGYGVLSRAALFLINAVAVKMLIPHDYGVFAYFLTIVSSIAVMSGMGLGVTANMYLAKNSILQPEDARRMIFSSLTVISIVAAILSPIFVVATGIGEYFQSNSEWMLYLLLFVLIWLMSVNGVLEGGLNGIGAFARMSRNALLVFILAVPVAMVLFSWKGLMGGFLAILFYRATIAVLNAVLLCKHGLLGLYSFSVLFDSKILRVLGGVSLPALLGALMTAPVVAFAMQMVASKPNGLAVVGYFSWVYQIYVIAVFVPVSLGGFFLSKLSSGNRGYGIKRVLFVNFAISSSIALGLAALKPFVLGYAGVDYVLHASMVYNVMIPVVVLFSLNLSFGSYWASASLGWIGFSINLIWACVFLLATSVGLRFDLMLALPVAFAVAYFSQLGVQFLFYMRLKG